MISDAKPKEFTEPEMNLSFRQALEICPAGNHSRDQRPISTRTGAEDSWPPTSHTCSGRVSQRPIVPVSSILRSHAIQIMNDQGTQTRSRTSQKIVKFLSEKGAVWGGGTTGVRDQVARRSAFRRQKTFDPPPSPPSFRRSTNPDAPPTGLTRRPGAAAKQEAMDAASRRPRLWQAGAQRRQSPT